MSVLLLLLFIPCLSMAFVLRGWQFDDVAGAPLVAPSCFDLGDWSLCPATSDAYQIYAAVADSCVPQLAAVVTLDGAVRFYNGSAFISPAYTNVPLDSTVTGACWPLALASNGTLYPTLESLGDGAWDLIGTGNSTVLLSHHTDLALRYYAPDLSTSVAVGAPYAVQGPGTVFDLVARHSYNVTHCEPGRGGVLCAPCVPGTYKAVWGPGTCTPCPAGTFGDFAGLASVVGCLPCDEPSACPPGSIVQSPPGAAVVLETTVPVVRDMPEVQPEEALSITIVPYIAVATAMALLVGLAVVRYVPSRHRLHRACRVFDFMNGQSQAYGIAATLLLAFIGIVCLVFAISFIATGQNRRIEISTCLWDTSAEGQPPPFHTPTIENVAVDPSEQWVTFQLVAGPAGGGSVANYTVGLPALGRGTVQVPWLPRVFVDCTGSVVGQLFGMDYIAQRNCTVDTSRYHVRAMAAVALERDEAGVDVQLVPAVLASTLYERVEDVMQQSGQYVVLLAAVAAVSLWTVAKWLDSSLGLAMSCIHPKR